MSTILFAILLGFCGAVGTAGNGTGNRKLEVGGAGSGAGGSMKGDDGGVSMWYVNSKSSGVIEHERDDSMLGVPGDDAVGVFKLEALVKQAMNRPLACGCASQLSLNWKCVDHTACAQD